ncbi:MAG: hypothetical protein HN612_02275, partial [Kordiimonadaceae bacterium]|nr:hypothetical protein [Kordiimonadaceae bacterium]
MKNFIFGRSAINLFRNLSIILFIITGCAPQLKIGEQLDMVSVPEQWMVPDMEGVRSE